MLLNPTASCTTGLASLKPVTWFRLYRAGSREVQWQRCLGCTPFPKLLYSTPGPRADRACPSWTCPMHLKSSHSWLGKWRGYFAILLFNPSRAKGQIGLPGPRGLAASPPRFCSHFIIIYLTICASTGSTPETPLPSSGPPCFPCCSAA